MVVDYFISWCNAYVINRDNPSIESPLKNYGQRDNALTSRVKAATQADDSTLKKYIEGHFLLMSAENKNGVILEEYLAKVLEPYGWIWCAGSTFKATDFCYLDKETVLLQVKNKYNSENSSSAGIRAGTKILKWHRLNQPQKKFGIGMPLPNWAELQTLVEADENLAKLLTEEAYLNYIEKYSVSNLETL
ncbi:SinI family restriction endonuclease [Alkalicoccobacillus gibsonii]|uniref:SinI family restriction endonuclease n=1 Tax=Alkalicoccobacillus gibsonii TaxID=79881 RepID=A0ABU9VEQ6_9BACI